MGAAIPRAVHDSILLEMQHVLSQSYFKRKSVIEFLNELITNEKLTVGQPDSFWSSVNFLNIQRGGSSQRYMLQQFDAILRNILGFGIDSCGSQSGPFVYIDDVIFSGNRIRHDLESWIKSNAPQSCIIHVIVIASHSSGEWYATREIKRAALAAGKNIKVYWWRCVEIEDRKSCINLSDVLRPTLIPDDVETQHYVEKLSNQGYPPLIRTVLDPPHQSNFFSSERGRQILEQNFLIVGVRIRQICPFLPEQIRPLGYSLLRTLGFGSVIVTFRNCPNTCPPALWAGNPWYPLFQRKTN
ncbi:MAG: hypothetical protein JETT_1639 [Candidatus Jettenia ecosi]|uniref:PRTase-CE domain-containing protein n=1 Tax=Candidatus Jettenia ecosi TaxID=2494326 RepID=A0A533QHD3_9BACT|nr:MAG: hypothetical protein JETT_1639 [Candidatus Jettenia ecosi]